MTDGSDSDPSHHAVARAISQPGPLTLAGYDTNGIQDFVTRGTALAYMRGASALVRDFDTPVGERADCLFAGGGRGRLLVKGAPDAPGNRRLLGELAEQFAGYRVPIGQPRHSRTSHAPQGRLRHLPSEHPTDAETE